MNPRAAALLLATIVAAPSVHYFRYERPVLNTPSQPGQACLTLDPAIFLHADPDLASLRLYDGEAETPYAINYAAPIPPSTKNITPLNLGLRSGTTSFDAAMPEGPYSDLDLDIEAKDFIATVRVTGSQSQTGAPVTVIGIYTIFDFTRQKLGRSTVLHLPPSDFRYLHFRIEGPIRPDQITGLTTERQSASQPQYITVATSSTVQQQDRDSIIRFNVPANVPVDRILVAPGAQPVNFSRQVSITVEPSTRPSTDAEEPPPFNATGNLLRIHSTRNGHKIDVERLSLDPPAYDSGFATSSGTKWTIAIHNQDDEPLTLQSVSLQSIARTLCFNAQPGVAYRLYYGDKALAAPHYDYATLFALDKNAARASLGPERPNPQYQPRPDTRPFTERHPVLLWIVLIAAIFLLGIIALRSGRQLRQPPS